MVGVDLSSVNLPCSLRHWHSFNYARAITKMKKTTTPPPRTRILQVRVCIFSWLIISLSFYVRICLRLFFSCSLCGLAYAHTFSVSDDVYAECTTQIFKESFQEAKARNAADKVASEAQNNVAAMKQAILKSAQNQPAPPPRSRPHSTDPTPRSPRQPARLPARHTSNTGAAPTVMPGGEVRCVFHLFNLFS